MKSWVEISGQRLAANYRLLADMVGAETSVMAVVKADAYGHGADLCAVVLAAAGAEWLGVTDAAEGVAVRASLAQAGIQPRMLVMSEALGEDAETVVEHGLTPVVSNVEQMEALARAAGNDASRPFGVHLEVDTGMARQGVSPGGALDDVLGWLSRQSAISLDGVMTHFASAEIAGSHQTSEQRTRFEQAVGQVVAAGLKPAWVHAGNSSTIDNPADAETATGSLRWLVEVARMAGARAMVRSGLALYGYSLPVEREQGYGGVARIADSIAVAAGDDVEDEGHRGARGRAWHEDRVQRDLYCPAPYAAGAASSGLRRRPETGTFCDGSAYRRLGDVWRSTRRDCGTCLDEPDDC